MTRTAGGSRALALLLVITGAAGLLAAWVITIDKFKLLENPNFVPGCSLNPVVSCGNIMKSAWVSRRIMTASSRRDPASRGIARMTASTD